MQSDKLQSLIDYASKEIFNKTSVRETLFICFSVHTCIVNI